MSNPPGRRLAGYIQRGDAAGDGVFHLARLVEKPELATAEALVADGEHY